ncbi:hypothetical protein ACH5RR_009344 [Cinchona calisaya]|uniref:Bulb-type lectin domain-containing protein n=1 Tax=Cinchona calisaya TaxID=153742 RepID=A0ABD3AE68_9GENT
MAYAIIHLVFFISLFPLNALAQNNGTVAVGSIITASETSSPWLSPSQDFAFGFQPLKDKDLFLLSIWYNKIPEKTVVWYVNTIDPVPRGSKIELNSDFGLVLSDPQNQTLWNTEWILPDRVDHGFLNDTGNFILIGGSDNRRLWESFKLPADTLLPLQELEYGIDLISRQSETNFSRGRFYVRFQRDGNLVLTTKSVPTNVDDDAVYYQTKISDPLNSGYRIILNSNGAISLLKTNNQEEVILGSLSTSLPTSENYLRATIDFDGVFTLYYHPKISTANSKWSALWSVPDNICLSITGDKGSGACGFNSICNITNQRPNCECPEGYTLLDPNNKYGSCIPNFTPSCAKVEQLELYDLLVLKDIDWPLSDYEQIYPSNESVCRQACLQDCFCAVAIFRSNSCWKKKLPLSNGRVDTTLNAKAFIKYRKSAAP